MRVAYRRAPREYPSPFRPRYLGKAGIPGARAGTAGRAANAALARLAPGWAPTPPAQTPALPFSSAFKSNTAEPNSTHLNTVARAPFRMSSDREEVVNIM